MKRPRVVIAVGARPNFMKAAPLVRALNSKASVTLVHTGQHYDPGLSNYFFRDLKLARPKINLQVGSGKAGEQVALIVSRFSLALKKLRPDAVVVVGDVNSTLGCAVACANAKPRPLLIHVEAGLRSGDPTMPEELNRILVDHMSDLLFSPSTDAVENLRKEGIASHKIYMPGNVMIDSLRMLRDKGSPAAFKKLGLQPQGYALVTLHRPSNVDDLRQSKRILKALHWLQGRMRVVFPVHPRTQKLWNKHGLLKRLAQDRGILLTGPLGYRDFVYLMSKARVVLTDSGGIQEETTILGVPCLTLRKNTERPITITQGTNRLAGVNTKGIITACRKTLASPVRKKAAPPGWDGQAAGRIARVLLAKDGRASIMKAR